MGKKWKLCAVMVLLSYCLTAGLSPLELRRIRRAAFLAMFANAPTSIWLGLSRSRSESKAVQLDDGFSNPRPVFSH